MKRLYLMCCFLLAFTAILIACSPPALQPNEQAVTVSNLLNTKENVEIKLQVIAGVAVTADSRCAYDFNVNIWTCQLGDMPTYFQRDTVIFSFEPQTQYTCLIFYKDPNADSDIIQECT